MVKAANVYAVQREDPGDVRLELRATATGTQKIWRTAGNPAYGRSFIEVQYYSSHF